MVPKEEFEIWTMKRALLGLISPFRKKKFQWVMVSVYMAQTLKQLS